ncbi:winged helix-turn-helix transcriptional regulator [Gracilibacillus caseinilyticus]|uniref:Winged helix-turn-helix transcriptional regulator n=1 Tax=Gracilibacillus caseinilyticus TaxID=2932256 RepID=A0ABY4F101_9BACI|nr:winged helix-turn-helix transcriptional regulator [Gracilibacillus caseinilyticus]UOQ50346.1 winged helix-turn-helix transcriptional regulator [Gracilibacillus caseinilyticus]
MKKFSCGFEVTMEVIGGKWKGLVLYFLMDGPKRTSELKRIIPNITQKMLIQTLKDLEASGLVNRKMYNQVPPKVEYSPTELGESLKPILQEFCLWGSHYAEQVYAEGEFEIVSPEEAS